MAKKRRNRQRALESHFNPWDESEAAALGYPGVDGVPLENYTYSDRAPEDWVVSGPCIPGIKGRYFKSPQEALAWAQDKYGSWRVSLLEPQPKTRWAILVRKEIKLGRINAIRRVAEEARKAAGRGRDS